MQVFQNQNSGSPAPAPAEEEDVSDVPVLEPDQSAESAPVAEEEVIAPLDEPAPDPAPEPVPESAPVE